jgi:hypothetical protein
MAKKKKRSNKLLSRVILFAAALILMFGTSEIVKRLLTEPEALPSKVYTSTNTIIDKPKVEPDVTDKQNKGAVPEQGKADKKPESQPEQSKASQSPPAEQPLKANDKFVDPFMENYLNIYVNLANDTELEFYYLDNVVIKNSKFYKSLTEEIQKLRQAKIKYVLDDFKVEGITKGESESELVVQVSQVINKKTTKYIYVVYFDKNGVFIKDRK